MELFLEHAFVVLYDVGEQTPCPEVRLDHVRQGFARRPSSVMLFFREEEVCFVTELIRDSTSLADCPFVLSVSLYSYSGDVRLSTTDPLDLPIWTGRPGWIRLSIGQQLVATRIMRSERVSEYRVVVTAVEAEGEERSYVSQDGDVLSDLVEDADF